MNIRHIQEARELYGIDDWGAGYFGIDDQGMVCCHPTGEETPSIPIAKIIEQCQSQNVPSPMIIRFPQIIESQLDRMHTAFRSAIKELDYDGHHYGVFPYKVNQRREFIDHIVEYGRKFSYGLEVGSKTEFIAALSYPLAKDALLICNGFKDRQFIRMGFIAASMGKNVTMVLEGPDELQMLLETSKDFKVMPRIGLRAKLYSRGAGKWEKSSGESSKFGLTTNEVLRCLDLLDSVGLKNKLAMLHFHIGSQITEIKRIKNAIKEASRVYAKIVKMGFKIDFLNIGGGVGVDYDGSKTSFHSSANYSLQEFANDVVYVIGEVCRNEKIDHPNIVTESGRIVAAYHSVVVTDIREVQAVGELEELTDLDTLRDSKKLHKSLVELIYIHDNINRKNFVEYYHDAIEYYEELFTLFSLGYLKLKDRATGEELFHRICHKAIYFSTFQRHQLEEFEDLQKVMVSKYLANFSIFQSIPDSWSIDQLFPVMPLTQMGAKPNQKATIVDITCDSDGCLDQFVDRKDVKKVLDLHKPDPRTPYYLGFFLVGAYQESLSNEHNLFGAINEVEVEVSPQGDWEITKLTPGDPIVEILECRNYDIKEIFTRYRKQLKAAEETGRLKKSDATKMLDELISISAGLPYLIEPHFDNLQPQDAEKTRPTKASAQEMHH